jgi:hypothetical protein
MTTEIYGGVAAPTRIIVIFNTIEELSAVLPGIRHPSSPDLCLLGAPYTDAAIPKCLDDKHDEK